MKYRIKIITYKNGRKEFIPQLRKFMRWISIYSNGEANIAYEDIAACSTRDGALRSIDLHYAGNKKKQTIEFEYINK